MEQPSFESGAVNCQKKRGILIRISIIITHIVYINLLLNLVKHCSLTNVALYALALLPSLSLKTTFL